MRTIIRVENSQGIGMFRGTPNASEIDGLEFFASRYSSGFPTPYRDGIDITWDMYCAFVSLKQFHNWLKKTDIAILKQNGYKVYKLKVRTYSKGKFQICYKKQDVITKTEILIGL